jgi:hypothetical protein
MVGASDMASAAHFPDGLPELLAAVAIRGFEDLLVVLKAPLDDTGSQKGLEEVLRRYVRFGLLRPNLYRAMFSSRLADKLGGVHAKRRPPPRGASTYVALLRAKADALDVFTEQMRGLKADGMLRTDRPDVAAMTAATLAHGMVGVFIDEGIALGTTPKASLTTMRLALADTMVGELLHGLLSPPAGAGS